MNKFTDIFANFIEGFSFRQGSQDVKQVKKGAFLKAFTITLIIGLIGEYAFLIPLNLRSPQFIIYFCILLLIFNGLYFMLSQRFSRVLFVAQTQNQKKALLNKIVNREKTADFALLVAGYGEVTNDPLESIYTNPRDLENKYKLLGKLP